MKTPASYSILSDSCCPGDVPASLDTTVTLPQRNIPDELLSYFTPSRSKISPARTRRRAYSALSPVNHSGPCFKASTAASWSGLNIPESIWLFTLRIWAITSASAATIPMRQPAMLCALLREFSSRQQSLAPGWARMDSGLSLSMKLYGLSLHIMMPCLLPKSTSLAYRSSDAGAPVGMFG